MGILAALFSGLRVPGSPTQVFADEGSAQPQQALVDALLEQQAREDEGQLPGPDDMIVLERRPTVERGEELVAFKEGEQYR